MANSVPLAASQGYDVRAVRMPGNGPQLHRRRRPQSVCRKSARAITALVAPHDRSLSSGDRATDKHRCASRRCRTGRRFDERMFFDVGSEAPAGLCLPVELNRKIVAQFIDSLCAAHRSRAMHNDWVARISTRSRNPVSPAARKCRSRRRAPRTLHPHSTKVRRRQ